MRIAPAVLALACVAAAPDQPARVTLSIVGTSDLHGVTLPGHGGGGLPLLAGYVNNLRAARAADGGAVLLIDSGDTFQGDVESNLSEGALVVDAYNAMGYSAETIGNHDFDYGSIDSPAARQLPGDRRGALKSRTTQARYPFLAANLIDGSTGRLVEWPNVRPSVLVEAAGIKVGIVGVMTIDAMQSTIAANIQGLRLAPLAPAIAAEAAKLRAAGAEVIIVAAHAGGRCERFDQPADLSSCDDSEILRVARGLPRGLVDVIAAGHTHAGMAHLVEGIAIIQSFSRGQSFGRVDVTFERKTRRVVRTQPFAPHPIVAGEYEGKSVASDPAIVRAMAPALERVHALQATPLGVSLAAPIARAGSAGSPLGILFAEALRVAVPGADVAAVNNSTRGLRADLAAGPLTVGRLYDVFPFDNRIAQTTLTGAALGQWIAAEIQQGRRGSLGISGVDVRARCQADGLHVDLFRGAARIKDDEQLLAVAIGAPTPSGGLASPAFLGGVGPIGNAAVVREVVEEWFRRRGGAILQSPAVSGEKPLDCVVR